jgi:HEAT repeat protein
MALFGRPNIRKLKGRRDIAGLLKALEYVKDNSIRCQAIEALGDLMEESAVEPLLNLLEDEDFKNKDIIVSSLGKIGDARAVPPLIQRIRHKAAASRPQELAALRNIGFPSVSPLLDLLENKTTDTKDAVAVISLLEKIGGDESTEGLLRLLSSAHAGLIPCLSEVMGRLAHTKAVPSLVSALKAGPGETWAAHIVSTLRRLGWKPADIDEEAALAVAERNWTRLAEIGEPAADLILPLLQRGRASEIIRAVTVLGNIGGEQSIEQVAALLDDRRPDIVTAAARTLGKIGSSLAVDPLIQLLAEAGSSDILADAEKALLEIGEPAVDSLVGQLNSGDPEERKTAVRLLGEIGDRRALPFLTAARDDPSFFPDIDSALEKLGWQPPDQIS